MPSSDAVEAVGKHGRIVGPAVAVAVFEQPNAVVVLRVVVRLFAEVLVNVRQPIFDRLRRQIVVEPMGMAAVVLDPAALPKRLAHINPAAIVEAERHRIGEHRLGRPQLPLQPLRNLKSSKRLLALIGSFRDLRIVGRSGATSPGTAHAAAIGKRQIEEKARKETAS